MVALAWLLSLILWMLLLLLLVEAGVALVFVVVVSPFCCCCFVIIYTVCHGFKQSRLLHNCPAFESCSCEEQEERFFRRVTPASSLSLSAVVTSFAVCNTNC